jgi:LmbE family N-acetylglucosaminyl deacetylase
MEDVTPVLVVAPHPDDEAYGCGGALAKLVRRGASVHIAIVTDGSASHPGHPAVAPAEIAARRSDEARAAAAALGIDQGKLTFLGERDGTLACLESDEADRASAKIAELVSQVRPAAILLPCRQDGSSEHNAAFLLVKRGLERAAARPRILEFPVWSWWNPLRLLYPLFARRRVWRVGLEDVLSVKSRAVSVYVSQSLPIPPDTSAVLPPGFDPMFLTPEEFLFEW